MSGLSGLSGLSGIFGNIVYLLRDLFTTAESAPIASPHTAVPGPGTLTVIQTNGTISTAGGAAVIPVGTAVAFGLGWYGTTNQGRANGRTVFGTFTLSTIADAVPVGWAKTAAINFLGYSNLGAGVYISSALPRIIDNASERASALPENLLTGVIYQIAVIQRSAGAFVTIEGGIYPKPVLLHVLTGDSTSNQYPCTSNAKAAYTMDDFGVVDLTGPYTSDYGLADSRAATPTTGATATTPVEFHVEFTWTPASAEVLEFDLRRVGDDDRWIVRCSQSGSTIKLIEREAGVEVEKQSAAQTWTVGTPYRIYVAAPVGWYSAWVNGTHKWAGVVAGQTPVNLYGTGVKVSGFATGANLIVWPRELPSHPFGLNRPYSSFLTIGDSKSIYTGYPPVLQKSISTASAAWDFCYPQIDTGGISWGGRAATIDADLATHPGNPTVILINLGSNDAVAMPVEATFTANVAYVLDALHTKWPNAQMYLMRAWRRDYDTECNTIATWIESVLVGRAWATVGPDERVFLKAGDNGVTYTSDGIHPNTAGYALTAAQWQTTLGL